MKRSRLWWYERAAITLSIAVIAVIFNLMTHKHDYSVIIATALFGVADAAVVTGRLLRQYYVQNRAAKRKRGRINK